MTYVHSATIHSHTPARFTHCASARHTRPRADYALRAIFNFIFHKKKTRWKEENYSGIDKHASQLSTSSDAPPTSPWETKTGTVCVAPLWRERIQA